MVALILGYALGVMSLIQSEQTHTAPEDVHLEPVCCKKQQKTFLTSYWFAK